MAVVKAFAVLDVKAGFYAHPFFMPAAGMAARAFGDACNDPNSAFSKHPGDYRLFEVGTFDDTVGRLVALEVPVLLGSGSDYVKPADDRQLSLKAVQ